MKPFIKWTGGKSKLLPNIRSLMPKNYNRYIEPFVGGGALYFDLDHKKDAIIGDFNFELVNTYRVVRDNLNDLITALEGHEFTKDYYYTIRNVDRLAFYETHFSPVMRASRFIYLNKTCFNGLYRVNSKGQFNVPMGSYKNPRIDYELLEQASKKLAYTSISYGTYSDLELSIKKGDFVYFDPPYIPLNETSNFTDYTKYGFGIMAHYSLRDFCDRLDSRDVYWMLSNSDTPLARELYSNYNIHTVEAARSINSNGKKRNKVNELIITNYA